MSDFISGFCSVFYTTFHMTPAARHALGVFVALLTIPLLCGFVGVVFLIVADEFSSVVKKRKSK